MIISGFLGHVNCNWFGNGRESQKSVYLGIVSELFFMGEHHRFLQIVPNERLRCGSCSAFRFYRSN